MHLVPVFGAAAQGIPLACLALVARGASIPESQGTITITEIVLGQPPPPGHCADSRLKHTPRLSVKEACFLVLELQPEGQASDSAHN